MNNEVESRGLEVTQNCVILVFHCLPPQNKKNHEDLNPDILKSNR
jgi:hypothetical protein